MRSFRQKVFVSYILLLLLFLGLMFPFVTNSVQQIVFRSMNDCADELIQELIVAKNAEEMVENLKERRSLLFYRVGILDSQRRLLYDSHTKRLLGTPFFPLQFVTHPEIEDALQYGSGYAEEYSHLLGQKLIYVAKRFFFHDEPYVIRLAFPYQYIHDLRYGFTFGFLFFGSLLLFLFSGIAVIVLNHFSSPIRDIIRAIRNYKEGNLGTLPDIHLKTDPQDEFTHLANTVNSLSKRVRSEIQLVTRERNEKEAILESLSEGVIAVDQEFRVSYANKTALAFLDLPRTIVGKQLPESLHPKYQRLLQRCTTTQALATDEIEIKRPARNLYLNLIATPQHGEGALLVLHDTSTHHHITEMRKAFIANASHELKTPITVIRGFAETLHENSELPQETIQEVTQRIVDNCRRMTSIIKNLLTIADIENLPSFRVSPYSLVDLVHNCAKTTQAVWPHASISVVPAGDDPFEVEVDGSLIEIAISNLLDNAVKYAENAPEITVHLAHSTPWITIAISDNGIGIAEEELENIFQRFYRVNKTRSSKLGSSGLGLSIVETIVQKHLGRVEVSSTLGKGSTFTIYLPHRLSEALQKLEETSQ